MSRLVTSKRGPGEELPTAATTGSEAVQDYLERVAKYVPVEIIAAYMTIRGFVPAHGASGALPAWAEIALYAALVALTPLYLLRVVGEAPRRATQIAISTVSFVVWSYAIGGPFFWGALSAVVHAEVVLPALAGALVVLWSLAAGLFKPE
jgi:hypothetical protein